MRLFTALWPVEDALRHLDRAVRAVDQEDLAAATGGVAQVPVHLPGPLALDLVLPRRRRRSAGHDRAGGEPGGRSAGGVRASAAVGRGRDVPRGAVDRGAAGGGGRRDRVAAAGGGG